MNSDSNRSSAKNTKNDELWPAVPLPNGAAKFALNADHNAGLWYNKFCLWHMEAKGEWKKGEVIKSTWVESVCRSPVGNQDLISEYSERRKIMLFAMRGLPICVKSVSRFVTGLGYQHPVENGFAWHPTLGTPYIPGSGLKGVARTWATLLDTPKGDVDRIFGPRRDEKSEAPDSLSNEGNAGSVVFLDAIVCGQVTLVPEVMTPHYSPYYQNGDPPADYHSPTPIPFLAVSENTSFLGGVAPRRAGANEVAKDVEKAKEWLLRGLIEIGAGAKTAVGYGRFAHDDATERAWTDWAEKKREDDPNAPPIEKMRRLLRKKQEGTVYQLALRLVRPNESVEGIDRIAFLNAVQETDFFRSWARGRAVDSKQNPANERKLKELAKLILQATTDGKGSN